MSGLKELKLEVNMKIDKFRRDLMGKTVELLEKLEGDNSINPVFESRKLSIENYQIEISICITKKP